MQLNDAALTWEPETSVALGFGFRCGFLGLLHMEITRERLQREFGLDLISTAPNVVYRLVGEDGREQVVTNPSDWPDGKAQAIFEPIVKTTVIAPSEFVGTIMELCQSRRGELGGMDYLSETRVELRYTMPMAEIIFDFFDSLKSRTRGYASLDYEEAGEQEAALVKVDILLQGEAVDAFSAIVHKDSAFAYGNKMTTKLKELIPRQQFEVPVQAAVGSKIIARENIRAIRKDVLAKCYGGDISRKRKLLEKQKEGKKRMKTIGRVDVPQEAFVAALSADAPRTRRRASSRGEPGADTQCAPARSTGLRVRGGLGLPPRFHRGDGVAPRGGRVHREGSCGTDVCQHRRGAGTVGAGPRPCRRHLLHPRRGRQHTRAKPHRDRARAAALRPRHDHRPGPEAVRKDRGSARPSRRAGSRRTLGATAGQAVREAVRAGAGLDDDGQRQMREIASRLSVLTTTFSQYVLDESNDAAVHIVEEAALDGLSPASIAAAADAAREAGHDDGHLLTIELPTSQSVLTSLTDPATRAAVFDAATTRGARGGDHDTRAIVVEIAGLRARRARLLGYRDHAEFEIAEQTAPDADAVEAVLRDLVAAAMRAGGRELTRLRALAGEEVGPADLTFWLGRERRRTSAVSLDDFSEFCSLDTVLADGVFYAAGQLYGLRFVERDDLAGYHPDVRVWEVFDGAGASIGLYLGDFFARRSKRGGAWMNNVVDQSQLLGDQPIVVNVCNFTKPRAGEPCLLDFDQLTTLFHEFGHACTGCCRRCGTRRSRGRRCRAISSSSRRR